MFRIPVFALFLVSLECLVDVDYAVYSFSCSIFQTTVYREVVTTKPTEVFGEQTEWLFMFFATCLSP